MTSSAAMLGTYFVLFLVVSVAAQEVPDEPTEVDEGTIATLNVTDFDSLNSTTEERPSKCKEILQGFVNESVNSTRPLIEEHVLNATRDLLADEILPEVTLQIETEVATAENRLTQNVEGLISGLAQKVTALEGKVTVLEGSIASKDAEIGELKQRLNVLDTKVIFSAVKNKGGNFQGNITYDNLVVNLGEGFDIGSGTFVVPTSGFYRLSFSTQTAYEKYDYTRLFVQNNGSTIYQIWGNGNREDHLNNVAYTWIMNLSRSDRISLYSPTYLWAYADAPVTFTGELIHI